MRWWFRFLGQVFKFGSPFVEDGPDDGKRKRYAAGFALEARRSELMTSQAGDEAQMIEPEHPRLSVVRQCELVSISFPPT
jgi:hypothetical protein